MNYKLNAKELLQHFDLRDYVEGQAGVVIDDRKTQTDSKGRLWVYAPWRGEDTASVVVDETSFYDFGDCSRRGDALDWLQWTAGLTFKAALETVSNGLSVAASLPKAPRKEHKRIPPPSYDYALKLASQRDAKAWDYIKARGISEDVARKHLLGVTETRHEFKMPDGEKFLYRVRRYSIPNIFWRSDGKPIVYGINRRLDDDAALRVYDLIGETNPIVFDAMNAYLAQKAPEMSLPKAALKYLFGDKYQQVAGSVSAIFNMNALTGHTPYVFFFESEYDALVMLSHGYNAVACPELHSVNYAHAFRHMKYVIRVSDADEAGVAKATFHCERIGDKAIQVSPPKPFKDIGEFVAKRDNLLTAWAESMIQLAQKKIG